MKKISMILAVAQIVKGDKPIGYRLANLSSENDNIEIKDVPMGSLQVAMANHMNIENLVIACGQIVGTQGSIERLPKISLNGQLVKNNSLLIAYEIGDVGYRVVRWEGTSAKLRTEDIIKLVNEKKIDGVSNAKIVERDGLQFISAINGEFKSVALEKQEKTAKVTAKDILADGKQQRVLSKTVDMNAQQVRDEIEYNDTFNLLNASQRQCIEAYYTWWTTSTFDGLTKGTRDGLKANPKKIQALAELRGKDIDWRYAGVKLAALYSKTGVDYCSLGHKLSYVHFARGVDKEGHEYKIKFGSTCVSDFFDISPKGLTQLMKVTTAMKDEIQIISDMVRNKEVEAEWNKVGLMVDIVDEIEKHYGREGAVNKLSEIFGTDYGKYLVAFRAVDIPYPESLLTLCRKYAEKSGKWSTFWLKVYGSLDEKWAKGGVEYISSVNKLSYTIPSRINRFLEFMFESQLEGKYGYDPINKIGERGQGRFTKEAAQQRKQDLRTFNGLGFEEFRLEDIKNVGNVYIVYKTISGVVDSHWEKLKTPRIKKFFEDDTRQEVLDNQYRKLINYYSDENSRILNNEDTSDEVWKQAVAYQAAIIGWNLFHRDNNVGYVSVSSRSFPKPNYYSDRNWERKRINAGNCYDMLRAFSENIDYIDDGIKKVFNNLEKDLVRKEREKAESDRRKAEAELARKRQEHIKCIVCGKEDCKYINKDGSCAYLIEDNKLLGDKISVNEYDYVNKCEVYEVEGTGDTGAGETGASGDGDIGASETSGTGGTGALEAGEASGDEKEASVKRKDVYIDAYLTYERIKKLLEYKDMLNIMPDSYYIDVAESILKKDKYKSDEDLTYKQVRVIRLAIKDIRRELNKNNLDIDFDCEPVTLKSIDGKPVKVVIHKKKEEEANNREDRNGDESSEWPKLLESNPSIEKDVKKVLKAASEGNEKLSTRTSSIAFTVMKYGKISEKQYEALKKGLEKLES